MARAKAKKATDELERIEAALDRAGIYAPDGIAERVEWLIAEARKLAIAKRDLEFDAAPGAKG